MAITGGFGFSLDLTTMSRRDWAVGNDGVKRWVDNDEKVDDITDDIGCAAGVEPCACAVAVMRDAKKLEQDALRYRYLRSRNLNSIESGGLFVGMTPHNLVLNGEDLDYTIDLVMSK